MKTPIEQYSENMTAYKYAELNFLRAVDALYTQILDAGRMESLISNTNEATRLFLYRIAELQTNAVEQARSPISKRSQ